MWLLVSGEGFDINDSTKRGDIRGKSEAKNGNQRKLHDEYTSGMKDKVTSAQVVCGVRRLAEGKSNTLASL